jgi:hypothetical protein
VTRPTRGVWDSLLEGVPIATGLITAAAVYFWVAASLTGTVARHRVDDGAVSTRWAGIGSAANDASRLLCGT